MPHGSEYNVPSATRLRGPLDPAAMERAIARLAERHSLLRATFPLVDGVPVLLIAPHATVPFAVTDLADLPAQARDRALAEEVDRIALGAFDLVHGPLFRAGLIRLAADDHVLVLSFHQIVVDGWSMGIVERDLGLDYTAALEGRTDALPAPPYDYRDYAAAERGMLAGPRRAEAMAYWREQLAGAPEQLSLPTDWPHPNARSDAGDARSFLLPPRLIQQAQALADGRRVTKFVLLLAAYAALLSRLSGSEEVVVGVPVSGRTTPDVEGVVGLFVNMLPLRVRLRPGITFAELLHQVQDTFLAGHAYQDLPFQQVVEELQPERTTSRHPVFQSVFTYEDAVAAPCGFPGLTASPVPIRTKTAKFELTLHLAWGAEQATGWMGYQTDLYEAATAQLLGERYVRLLAAALAAPDEPLSGMSVLGAQEERNLLAGSLEPPVPGAQCVDRMVERQARERPDAVAVRDGELTLSYAELDRRAERVAARLRASGARPGSLVATCLPRGADLVTAQFGIFKSGAAYLPLDPANPPGRLAAVLAEADPLLTLTDQRHAGGRDLGRVLTMDAILAEPEPEPEPEQQHEQPAARAEPTDLAYVIYTSGSTGVPKGVMIEHRALANLVAWHHREFGVGPDDRTALIAAPGFDASVWEVWPALAAGATLEVPDAGTVLSPDELTDWLAAREVTSCFVPTPMVEWMAEAPWPVSGALRSVLTGGDRLHGVARRELPFRLVNNYGPTEATVVATSGTVTADPHGRGGLPDIGRPIPGTEAYVLDELLRPVPVGMSGELYLGGVALARGYLGRPELTADRFVPHPFSRTPGARLYRTGDLVRRRSDGTFDFLGRNDQQLKVRGFRIEAGEIENVLRTHPGVRDAIVGVVPAAGGGAELDLTAYLVLATPSAPPDRAELHEHVGRRLPGYMCPHDYQVLASLPLTSNGKVDRAALAAKAVPLTAPATADAGRTPLEREIAGVWARALGHDRFGTHDNFFDIGGHSLLLATVHDILSRESGREVSILVLFEYPTVASLARRLEAADTGPAEDAPTPTRTDSTRTDSTRTTGTDQAAHPAAEPAAERLRRGSPRLKAMRAQNRRTDPTPVGRTDMIGEDNDTHIAVVGMACRFPGASTPEEYWDNLVAGVDSVRPFSRQELEEWGHDPDVTDPRYVLMHGVVDGIGEFDADFFQFSTRDATLLNPQHRLFLECAWEALERAGYDPRATPGTVGVFAGAGRNAYGSVVQAQADRFPGVDGLSLLIANEPEHLATRVSYKLGLTGPSIAVMTACSTSLVAVHEASQALLAGECDVALAGGVTLQLPRSGYSYREGGTMSPDGRCRTFSADAKGIVGGDGAGVVVLRRLHDALADGDHIHAVIRGSAVNNDGHDRAGFTAPGVRGQAEVIRLAHAAAEVEPETISYVEAHGTGTPVGDPIEVNALTQAFRGGAVTPGSVLLGSVKTNIGHTDTAAGVAGLIKAVLALEHRTVPATLHFTRPNPAIDFAAGPFTVNTERRDWEASAFPRRAGVSSFGIGGTNAHVVLEEAPQTPLPAEPTGRSRLLLLSARSPEALAAAGRRLAQHLLRHPELSLAEVACTLQLGRHAFAHRRYLVCADHTGAVTALIAPAAAAAPAADRALPQDPNALLDLLRADQPDQVLPDEERAAVLDALGRLWQQGAPVDWTRLYAGARPRRVPLPTYPFERRTHLVRPEPFARDQQTAVAAESDDRALIGDSAAPEAVEDRLMVLFGKVLGSSDGLDERGFFELGGDSLSAVQLLSLVEDEFGVSPPLEAVFDAPTVREFAVVIVDQLALLHATETDSEARGKA